MSAAAEHMDRMYRHQRYIYDASRKFYLLGRDGLIRELQPPESGSVLEIGCGTARNLILAARAYPHARFYGVDISQEMLNTAQQNLKAKSLDKRVNVALADATHIPAAQLFGRESFDRVFISYALSMIPPWQDAIEQALDLLAPGGSLHIVDFGDFGSLPSWFGMGMRKWLSAFSVTPRPELETVLRNLAAQRGMAVTFINGFGGYTCHTVAVAPGSSGKPGPTARADSSHISG